MSARRDRQLVIDADRLASLFDAHAGRMTGFFARRVGCAEIAVDLTAETFAQAFASRRRFQGTDEDAVGWLYGIARNLLARHLRDGEIHRRALRRLGVTSPELVDEDIERILELSGHDELQRAAASALGALPAKQQEAVTLRVVEELEYEELATRLGVTEQTARSRVSRGLRRLAVTLAAWNPRGV